MSDEEIAAFWRAWDEYQVLWSKNPRDMLLGAKYMRSTSGKVEWDPEAMEARFPDAIFETFCELTHGGRHPSRPSAALDTKEGT